MLVYIIVIGGSDDYFLMLLIASVKATKSTMAKAM